MEKRIQPPIPLDTGSNRADEEEMATADAGLPVAGCGMPSLQGLLHDGANLDISYRSVLG